MSELGLRAREIISSEYWDEVFVGLMMPHLVRMVAGGDNARVLPGSALAGAVFLIWADAGARVVMAPEDLPIGIVTGLTGGLFFLWLMMRRV